MRAVVGSHTWKIPEPTNTPSHPSCIISAASAGVATPPAAKFTTGNLFSLAVSFNKWNGACMSFAYAYNSSSLITLIFRIELLTAL